MSLPEQQTDSIDSDDSEAKRLGSRLKSLREYLDFSQHLVSEKTGIPRSAISDIERGARKVDSLELRKLAQLYSYPVAYFLDADEDAAVGRHAIEAMARALSPLDDAERQQVIAFAEFLRQRKAGKKEAETDPQENP